MTILGMGSAWLRSSNESHATDVRGRTPFISHGRTGVEPSILDCKEGGEGERVNASGFP